MNKLLALKTQVLEWINEFIYNILRKLPYVCHIETELKKCRSGDFSISSIHYTNGVLNASFKTSLTATLAEWAYEMLKDYPTANNYLEIGVAHQSEPFACAILIQRHDGLTPHQLRIQAEQERDRLKEELRMLTESVNA